MRKILFYLFVFTNILFSNAIGEIAYIDINYILKTFDSTEFKDLYIGEAGLGNGNTFLYLTLIAEKLGLKIIGFKADKISLVLSILILFNSSTAIFLSDLYF